MHWYQGGIAEAVTASKKAGAIFVVFVEGKDTQSTELTKLIDTEEVSRQLESQHFVAIKVEENSVPHQQFSQIYKDVTVPSIFFIGKTGTPLEIIKEPHNVADFSTKLKKILQSNGVSIPAEQSRSFIKAEQAQDNPVVVCENDVCTIKPKDEPSTSKTTESEVKLDEQTDASPEDKVERAKELLSQKREAKKVEEEEKERVKELERRKVGHDVQKLKRWQQENELKELMDERNKEKKEQQEARQRVLAQIAQDKAERAAKFANPPPNTQQSPQMSPQPTHRVTTNSNTARLQFKLPDGSSHMHEFSSNTTLQDVRNYIITNLELSFNSFSLSTTFPRREFTSEEGSATLLALELVPNAVILVLPLHNGAVATNSDSWLMTLFWSVVGPILNIVGYLKSMLFGSPTPRAKSPPPAQQPQKRPNESSGEPSSGPKRRIGETTVVRRHGNVHRLSDKTDSDDENNTWNGNSTQQM